MVRVVSLVGIFTKDEVSFFIGVSFVGIFTKDDVSFVRLVSFVGILAGGVSINFNSFKKLVKRGIKDKVSFFIVVSFVGIFTKDKVSFFIGVSFKFCIQIEQPIEKD